MKETIAFILNDIIKKTYSELTLVEVYLQTRLYIFKSISNQKI